MPAVAASSGRAPNARAINGKHAGNQPQNVQAAARARARASGRRQTCATFQLQRQEIERADGGPRRQPRTDGEGRGDQVLSSEQEVRHCLCIHRHADQQPEPTPSISNGALQKMPVPNMWSSHRPTNRPIERRRHDHPAQDADLADEARHRRLAFASTSAAGVRVALANRVGQAVRARSGSGPRAVGAHGPPPDMSGRSGRRIADDLPDRLHLQLQTLGARRPLRLEPRRGTPPAPPVSSWSRSSPVSASRVAIATSAPLVTDRTPRRTAQKLPVAVAHAASSRPTPSAPSGNRHGPGECRSCRSRPRRARATTSGSSTTTAVGVVISESHDGAAACPGSASLARASSIVPTI